MTTPDVSCPMCEATQEVSHDEYGVFRLDCHDCGGTAMGEYSPGSDTVAWRWRKPAETTD